MEGSEVWKVLGEFCVGLGGSWAALGTVLAAHEAITGSFWVIFERDSLIQFIDSNY